MLTVVQSRPDITALLLQTGANPNARDLFGQTALLSAVARGRSRFALLLLEQHADPQASDDAGNTPLHLAARRGDAAVVAALLARGADPRVRNATAATPSDEAARAGHAKTAAAIAAAASMNRRVAMSRMSARRGTRTPKRRPELLRIVPPAPAAVSIDDRGRVRSVAASRNVRSIQCGAGVAHCAYGALRHRGRLRAAFAAPAGTTGAHTAGARDCSAHCRR
jgi:hypothetical protein